MPASLRRFPYVQMKIFFILVVDGSMPLKKEPMYTVTRHSKEASSKKK